MPSVELLFFFLKKKKNGVYTSEDYTSHDFMLNANEMEICDGGGLPILITLLYIVHTHCT